MYTSLITCNNKLKGRNVFQTLLMSAVNMHVRSHSLCNPNDLYVHVNYDLYTLHYKCSISVMDSVRCTEGCDQTFLLQVLYKLAPNGQP